MQNTTNQRGCHKLLYAEYDQSKRLPQVFVCRIRPIKEVATSFCMQNTTNQRGCHKLLYAEYDQSKRLPQAFVSALEPIFERLTDDAILSLHGFTQNQNESLNGTFWNCCPKTRFCVKRRVEISVGETICQFNSGPGAIVEHLSSVGAKYLPIRRALCKEDKRRLHEAARSFHQGTSGTSKEAGQSINQNH